EADIRDLDSDHAIHFQHTDHRSKYGEIEEDLKVLYQFSCHAGEKIETLIDEPFYKKLDAFVDGMQDLSITTYSTTNRIGAKSIQTYMSSYGGQPQVIESVKESATIEDLMNGDNFYANQMTLQYDAWKRENPDQKVSEADFKMGMLHTRAFDYKSIKDEQEEKEFWVNIVAAVVIVGVSIVCPPAGLALGVGFGALEASSAISGKDWISGRELSDQERLLRGGFALLDIIPGVKAFSSGTKIASAGSKVLRVGDDLLDGGKLTIKNAGKSFKGTIDNGIQAGKQTLDLRIANVKKVTDDAMQATKKKLTKDLNDIGEAAKTIQSKAKETFQIPPRERLAFAGAGGLSEPTTIAKAFDAGKNKLQEVMSKMDGLNIKGSGKDDIIEGVSGAGASKIEDVLSDASKLSDNAFDDIVEGVAKTADDVPVIREVDYGDHIVKGQNGRKDLDKSVQYITEDGYKYTTDELGRIVDVDAEELVLETAERNEGMQRIAGREDRLPDDDGGHLIGSQFHGSGDIDNLVAQNSQINRSGGEWYSMEQEWASALKENPPRKVTVKIEPQYLGTSLRPDAFRVSYSIEGLGDFNRFIENVAGGK
ncbi:DNA/RNA non-specific endonuclease, partial [Listeria ivanovii]